MAHKKHNPLHHVIKSQRSIVENVIKFVWRIKRTVHRPFNYVFTLANSNLYAFISQNPTMNSRDLYEYKS
jgi:hypothetical protein